MTNCRIALANLSIAGTPEGSVDLAVEAIAEAGRRGVQIICFPECYIPGYRWYADTLPPPSLPLLESAWGRVGAAAKSAGISVILSTERPTEHGLQITARVYNPDGSTQGWQDKGQLDPSEEAHYPAFGSERREFTAGDVTFGIVICHEGWRYPETVRWATRRGAQIVFHPFHTLPSRVPTGPKHSRTLTTPSTRRRCFVARPRITAGSHRLTARATARPLPQRLFDPMARCCPTSHTAKQDCLSQTST